MSYILDALKKAESERQLGSIPNLHAHSAAAPAFGAYPASSRKGWLWIAIAAVIVLLLMAAWYILRTEVSSPVTVASVTGTAAAEIQPAPPPPVAEAPVVRPQPDTSEARPRPPKPAASKIAAPGTPAPAIAPTLKAGSGAPLTVTRELAARSEPAPAIAYTLPPEPFKPSVDLRPLKAPPAEKPALAAKNPEAVAAPPAELQVGSQRELPENIQREIPALAINGYIYSSNPAERSMLINTILRREGDQVAPNLVLEKMMPKEAIFNYKGYRYRAGYK